MKQVLSLLLVALTLISPVFTTGCTNTQVQDTLLVAEQVAENAAVVLQPLNPEAATALSKVDTALKAVGKTYGDYYAATEDKPGKLILLQGAVNAVSANLHDLLNVAGVRNPEINLYVTAAVAIANTTINLVVAHLPKATQSVAHVNTTMFGAPLPVVPGKPKSASDLANYWNSQVGALHPEAMVRAR
jgi:hypothetical protein